MHRLYCVRIITEMHLEGSNQSNIKPSWTKRGEDVQPLIEIFKDVS